MTFFDTYYFELFWIFLETLKFLIVDFISKEGRMNVCYDCYLGRMNPGQFFIFLYLKDASWIVSYHCAFLAFKCGKRRIARSLLLRKTVHTSDPQFFFVF